MAIEDGIKTEYLNVKDLISEEEFVEKCEKLYRKLGFIPTKFYDENYYSYKESDDRLYLHDLNHFPLKAIFEYDFESPLKKQDAAKILSESLKSDIDLINTGDHAII